MGFPPQGTKANVSTLEARLTALRAGYLDELKAANLPSDVDDTLYNVSVLQHHMHSRTRVYPQDVGATITLAAHATANTFGDWTQIIPITTIGFEYKVIGLVIEQVNAVTTYFVQLGFSIVDGSDPTTAQILGERRIKLVTVPIAKATELLEFYSKECPANAKLWGRLKTASVAADEAEVSVAVMRHLEITNPLAHLTTWPWAT